MNQSGQRSRQDALLVKLVAMAVCARPRAWESFVALQSDGATVTVHHPRAIPLKMSIECAADLDALAVEGALALTRTPRGSRVFTITPVGYQRADGLHRATTSATS